MKPSSEAIYQFLLTCGREHDVHSLCAAIAKELRRLVQYDQARVIFLDISGKITTSLLYGVKQKNWNTFMDYYSADCIGSLYSLKTPLRLSEDEKVELCDWTDADRQGRNKQFVMDYVRPLRLNYCLGMGFSDGENCIRCIISLDRTGNCPYTEEEISLIRALHPLMDNLVVNLFTAPPKSSQGFLFDQYGLTSRELEIAGLLCQGSAPSAISQRLCISVNTTYKHIANMYRKLNVTNRQEFIARVTEEVNRRL